MKRKLIDVRYGAPFDGLMISMLDKKSTKFDDRCRWVDVKSGVKESACVELRSEWDGCEWGF